MNKSKKKHRRKALEPVTLKKWTTVLITLYLAYILLKKVFGSIIVFVLMPAVFIGFFLFSAAFFYLAVRSFELYKKSKTKTLKRLWIVNLIAFIFVFIGPFLGLHMFLDFYLLYPFRMAEVVSLSEEASDTKMSWESSIHILSDGGKIFYYPSLQDGKGGTAEEISPNKNFVFYHSRWILSSTKYVYRDNGEDVPGFSQVCDGVSRSIKLTPKWTWVSCS